MADPISNKDSDSRLKILDTFRKKVNAYTLHDINCNEYDNDALVHLLGDFDYS